MTNKIENSYARVLAGPLVDDLTQGVEKPNQHQTSDLPHKSPRKSTPRKCKEKKEPYVASEDQRRAVEKAQNASRRGRGRKKGERIPIHFVAEQRLVTSIEELHYRLEKTKNELYNEALGLLVEKYGVEE